MHESVRPRSKEEAEEEEEVVYYFGLKKIYSFIVIISSINKYRKHKSSMLI